MQVLINHQKEQQDVITAAQEFERSLPGQQHRCTMQQTLSKDAVTKGVLLQ